MRRFDDTKCPLCGAESVGQWGAVSVRFFPRCLWRRHSYMRGRCKRCGGTWKMLPLDETKMFDGVLSA